MKLIRCLSFPVITLAVVLLAFPFFLLLVIALLQALLIELLRKIFRRPAMENLIQISFHKAAPLQKANLPPHYQHGLSGGMKKEFSQTIKKQIQQSVNPGWLPGTKKITNAKGYELLKSSVRE